MLQVGAVRKLTLGQYIIWEPLLALSEKDTTVSYGMIPPSESRPLDKCPFPSFPHDYHATITLRPVTEGGGTYIDFAATFVTEANRAAATEGAIRNIFVAGFAELRKKFS